MSEKQEKRRRLNQRLAYTRAFHEWVNAKPPFFRFLKYRRWKQAMPVIEQYIETK